jgi:hypothetical protein
MSLEKKNASEFRNFFLRTLHALRTTREREREREREKERERERVNAQIIYTHHVVYPWVALVRWQLDEAEED